MCLGVDKTFLPNWTWPPGNGSWSLKWWCAQLYSDGWWKSRSSNLKRHYFHTHALSLMHLQWKSKTRDPGILIFFLYPRKTRKCHLNTMHGIKGPKASSCIRNTRPLHDVSMWGTEDLLILFMVQGCECLELPGSMWMVDAVSVFRDLQGLFIKLLCIPKLLPLDVHTGQLVEGLGYSRVVRI